MFRPFCNRDVQELENLAALLDTAVINHQEFGRFDELGSGRLYTSLQRYLTETMLAQYHRWVFQKNKNESVLTLHEWVLQECEFQVISAETLHGVNNKEVQKTYISDQLDTEHGKEQISNTQQYCRVCSESHGVKECDTFKSIAVSDRWDATKAHRLRYIHALDTSS